MSLEVRALNEEDPGWDRFVHSSPNGTIFHLRVWKRLVAEVFGYRAHYLLAADGDRIRGVLPLFEIRGLLTGRVLISIPHATYGGLCGDDPQARALLLARAGELAARERVQYVEFRHKAHPSAGLTTRAYFATFVRQLDPDPEANWSTIPRKRRASIRKCIKYGLESRVGWEPLSAFYALYVRNRRRLGSPPYSRRFFEAIRDGLGDGAGLLTIWHEKEMVAGVLSFFHRDEVIPYFGASLQRVAPGSVSDFLYWELMRRSCLAGSRSFDFGQSHPGSGTYAYKLHWGFEPSPLPYQYLPIRGRKIPGIGPSARLRPFVEAWKRLPVAVTARVGPMLVRRLPLH